MIFELTISLILLTAPPNHAWTPRDHATLLTAHLTCAARYPTSPAVVKFEIKSNDHYNVTCGVRK